MNIAIYGSCVSRDTCQFVPNSQVKAYVARQSVTSLLRPHGSANVDISQLKSPFQRRMVTSDLEGTGIAKICEHANDLDLVLLDLVDERRGYWEYPDGTTITNSVESEVGGINRAAQKAGARLIRFGEDEHFATWRHGFEKLIEALRAAGIWEKSLLLDIEWARYLAGSQHAFLNRHTQMGRRWRRIRRATRNAIRSISHGKGISTALMQMVNVNPTQAETFYDKAVRANVQYNRYRQAAREMVPMIVSRESQEVRIDPNHKWGPQPFHYLNEDYESIVRSIQAAVGTSLNEGGNADNDR